MKIEANPDFNILENLKKYPKIPDYGREFAGGKGIAFEKYDGTNLAWFYTDLYKSWDSPKFRSGNTFYSNNLDFGKSYDLFNKIQPKLSKIMSKFNTDGCFFGEYLGPNSFAGNHIQGDSKSLIPIDLWIKGIGFIPPDEFVTLLTEVDIQPPKIIYKGNLDGNFSEDLINGKYNVNEGVVFKGGQRGSLWCCKLKTKKWVDKLLNSGGEL